MMPRPGTVRLWTPVSVSRERGRRRPRAARVTFGYYGVQGSGSPALGRTQIVAAPICQKGEQPRAQIATSKTGDGAEGGEERLLGRVIGGGGVAEHPERQVVGLFLVPLNDRVERG